MPMDGFTLAFAARELAGALAGGRIERVTQPEKDALLLLVRAKGKNHRLLLCASPSCARAHLTARAFINPAEAPMFCMLMRKHLTGGRITDIRQVAGDRVLALTVDNRDELGDSGERTLYLEIMNRHSNLTLVKDGRIVDAIRHVTDDMSRVRQALPGLPYLPPPAQDKLDPASAGAEDYRAALQGQSGRLDKALAACVRGLSMTAARELALRVSGGEQTLLADCDLPSLCAALAAFFSRLPALAQPTLLLGGDGAAADVFPFVYLSHAREQQKRMPTLSAALDAFFGDKDARERIAQKSGAMVRLVKNLIERAEKKLAIQEDALRSGERTEEYRVCGELLTANLHAVKKGQESCEVYNFYDENGGALRIALDVKLSPAENAQKYFKRYRKARAARELAAGQKEKTLRELAILEGALDDLAKCENENDLSDVRAALEAEGFVRRAPGQKKQPPRAESAPLRFVSPDGIEILVGKNSRQNDRLTGAARGGETWLHAKDMPGSHVLVRTEGPVPEETLRCAARIAAWFSKGRGSANVPVDYTLRKYVKKPGGAPAGFVIYTHQKTLYVTPSERDVR